MWVWDQLILRSADTQRLLASTPFENGVLVVDLETQPGGLTGQIRDVFLPLVAWLEVSR